MPETVFKHHDVRFERAIYADGGIGGGGLGAGAFFFVKPTGNDSNDGKSWTAAKATIQAAIDAASAGDVLYIAPGAYDEEVTVDKGLLIIGVGRRGVVGVAPSGVDPVAITVTANNVTLVNVGAEGSGTGGGLLVQACARFRAIGCKLEGGDFAAKLESTAADSVADTRFDDCEFAWSDVGLLFAVSGGGDPVTQTYVRGCLFHNQVTASLKVDTVHTADLWVEGCTFLAQEDGTEPTDYVLASVASTTGTFTGNRFATATNAAATLTIAAGVFWVANATEAGWSTARPA